MRNATSCRSSSSSSSWTRIDSSTAAPNSDVALLTGGVGGRKIDWRRSFDGNQGLDEEKRGSSSDNHRLIVAVGPEPPVELIYAP